MGLSFIASGKKKAPGKKPYEMQSEKERERNRVVIRRIAFADVAEQVLVHKIEPEEPASLTRVRHANHQASGIAESRRNMPRRGNSQKQQRAGEQLEPEQACEGLR